jgi:hypothetical protein
VRCIKQLRVKEAAMRLVEFPFPPVNVSFTEEEILADLLYPAGGRSTG